MSLKSGRCCTAGMLVGMLLLSTGCDPSINLYGSFFPAWIWCLALGAGLTVVAHLVFLALQLERHLGPLILVYGCLILLLSCLAWLVLFRR